MKNAKDAETQLLGMIQDGELFARFDQRTGTVSFEEDSELYNTRTMVNTLDSKIMEVLSIFCHFAHYGEIMSEVSTFIDLVFLRSQNLPTS